MTTLHFDIVKATDNKSDVILVLLDRLSVAFNTIDHGILVTRLQNLFDFTGSVVQLFESYIRKRFQKVAIGCTASHGALY